MATKGDKPFSYTDALIAVGLGAVTQGRGFMAQEAINIGGAYLGSAIKDESPVGPMVGAGLGTAIGPIGGTIVKDKLSPIVNTRAAEISGAVAGSMVNEAVGQEVQKQMNNTGKGQ